MHTTCSRKPAQRSRANQQRNVGTPESSLFPRERYQAGTQQPRTLRLLRSDKAWFSSVSRHNQRDHGAWRSIRVHSTRQAPGTSRQTVRIIDVKYSSVNGLSDGTEVSRQLLAMLRSCSAFEAFRKSPGSQLQPAPVTEFLLLSKEFPRRILLPATSTAVSQSHFRRCCNTAAFSGPATGFRPGLFRVGLP
jgi:hypothetical protein